MDKEKIEDVHIEIQNGETLLKEGIMQIAQLISGLFRMSSTRFKYTVTDKGVYTRNKKSFLIKARTVFMPYSDLDSFLEGELYGQDCCMFNPKKGRSASKVLFDDHCAVVSIISKYLARQGQRKQKDT